MTNSKVQILFFDNPFNPTEDYQRFEHAGEITVRDWLAYCYSKPRPIDPEEPDAIWQLPTLCKLNGKYLMRAAWETTVLKAGDVLYFVTHPGWEGVIVALVVAVVSLVVAIVTMPAPVTPGTMPNADPAFALTGQRNQIRLMNPIESSYGLCRIFPSVASRAYNLYDGDQQYQFILLCVGQGFYDFNAIQIEDTPIDNFIEAQYEITEPGGSVTLFPDNVVTSVEVSSIQLFGPNEPEYIGGYNGPYVINDPTTLCNRIEVDISFPQGLYVSTNGFLGNTTVSLAFQYQQIDDSGTPVGAWIDMGPYSFTAKTNTPQRFTRGVDVTPGRYQVQAKRTTNTGAEATFVTDAYWEAVRAFLPSTKVYGDVTMIAFKVRATNNINDNSRSRFNVWATRKLPTWNPTDGWSEPIATRSIVWAFCDIFRAKYGGNLSDVYLDLPGLFAADAAYTVEGRNFDWTYDQKITVWDGARTAARVGRAVPMLFGSQIGIVRDKPKTVPSAMFTPDNMLPGSFKWDITFPAPDDSDYIIIEYVDPDTWTQETVECALPFFPKTNPDNIKLSGCTDRTIAYREGLYMLSSRLLQRQQYTFSTGLEGHLPNWGDLILLAHDVPRWGIFGEVLDITGTTVTLSKNITFPVGHTVVIAFKTKNGGVEGPHVITAGMVANEVICADLDAGNIFLDPQAEPVLFNLGISETFSKLCQITGLSPTEGEAVEVVCVEYVPEVFDYDTATPPTVPTTPIPPRNPDLPVVIGLIVGKEVGDRLMMAVVTWRPAAGAKSYIVEKSTDGGTTWKRVAQTIETEVSFILGYAVALTIRVAGVNVGLGPWTTWSGTLGVVKDKPAAAVGLVLASFTGLTLGATWQPATGAAGYVVRIKQTSTGNLYREDASDSPAYNYTNAMMLADSVTSGFAVHRDLTVEVLAANSAGDSDPISDSATNPAPAAPTGLSSTLASGTVYNCVWTHSAGTDLKQYLVYCDISTGFTPSPSNLVYQGTLHGCAIDVAVHGHFWKVSAMDLWGPEEIFSTEATI